MRELTVERSRVDRLLRELDSLKPLSHAIGPAQGGQAFSGWEVPDWLMQRIRAALVEVGSEPLTHLFKDEWVFQRSMTGGNPMAGEPVDPQQPCFDCGTPFAAHQPLAVRVTIADLYYDGVGPHGGVRTNGDLGGLVRRRLAEAAGDPREELWGPDGPYFGQVITIRGTTTRARWTGAFWDLISG